MQMNKTTRLLLTALLEKLGADAELAQAS